MSTTRKHWFRVADSVAHEPWSNDVAATFMRLLAHLNTRWAREGRTADQAVEVVLSRGTAMQLTGSGSLARARSILRELATNVSLTIDEQGANTSVRWPKFAKFQRLESDFGAGDKQDSSPSVPPPQDAPARRKTEEKKQESAPPAADAAPSETSATGPPSDQRPIRPRKQRPAPPPEAVQFAEDFRAAVQATNPGRDAPSSAAFAGWCDESRLLLAKRPEVEARALAKWLFNAGGNAVFWRGVVFCPGKFREKYDQIRKAKERDESTQGRSQRSGAGRAGPLAAIAEIRRRREEAREQSG